MICCTNCFADHHVRNQIGPTNKINRATCPICNTGESILFEIEQLAEQFELLYSSYRITKTGRNFVERIADDWRIFDERKINKASQHKLISSALGDTFPLDTPMAPLSLDKQEPLARWDDLKKELKENNRYFFNQTLIDMDRLSDLLAFLLNKDLPNTWYRGRICDSSKGYKLSEMGAPPGRLASHGRANPPGIPYLYLASKPTTTANEVRPQTGEKICIAEFETDGSITAIDLRNPRARVSPFILSDAVNIAQLHNDLPFIERLGEELTRPVMPKGAAIDYIPSQFLCEFIKKEGYNGVVYNSAMGDGFNLALFDPARAKPISQKTYTIDSVKVEIAITP